MFELLIDAALVLGPSTIAWVAGRRSGRGTARSLASLPAALMCTCGHGYGTHHDGGACSGTTECLLTSTDYGRTQEWERVPCGCHGYDGPEPLPRVWTPALWPDEVRRIG
jgi:hypothetical protein